MRARLSADGVCRLPEPSPASGRRAPWRQPYLSAIRSARPAATRSPLARAAGPAHGRAVVHAPRGCRDDACRCPIGSGDTSRGHQPAGCGLDCIRRTELASCRCGSVDACDARPRRRVPGSDTSVQYLPVDDCGAAVDVRPAYVPITCCWCVADDRAELLVPTRTRRHRLQRVVPHSNGRFADERTADAPGGPASASWRVWLRTTPQPARRLPVAATGPASSEA